MSYIQSPPLTEEEYQPFAALRARLGFVPNLYRAQTLRTDLIEAELGLMAAAVAKNSNLDRRQKEYILLAISARNLNTYCVTAHCEIVRALKIEGPEPEQIAIDHSVAKIPMADKALLSFAVKLNDSPTQVSEADIETLRTFGFCDEEILETIVLTGIAQFANTMAMGLGAVPDFQNARVNFQRNERIA